MKRAADKAARISHDRGGVPVHCGTTAIHSPVPAYVAHSRSGFGQHVPLALQGAALGTGPANAAVTQQPDKRFAARFSGLRAGCLGPDEPVRERLFPRGKIRRAGHGNYCFCDCMPYRQYLQGRAWSGPVGGTASRPSDTITRSDGSQGPRSISWSSAHLPLTLASIVTAQGAGRTGAGK